MLMNSFRFRAGLLACVTTFLAGAAAAQTAPPPKVGVEEVTVTAQKRSENVRKVPVSVSVLSGRLIKADHITNFADLTRAVPNLSFSSQAGEGLSTLEIRGIASQAGQATVAIYLDDVSLTTRNIYTEGTTEPRFLDISRIEVLRGPQATLYGASALGGTLRYISNPPKMDVYEGNVSTELSGTYHGGLNWDEQGVLNIPIAQDKAALRIAGETGGDSGYINDVNPATGQTVKANINSNGFDDARATLLLTPNDWLTITPMVYWQKAIARDVDAEYLALPNDQTPKVVAEPGHDSILVPSITFNADVGFAHLYAITSNYERHFQRTLDSTIYDSIALYTCDYLGCTDNNGNPVDNDPPGLEGALSKLPSYTFYDNTVRQWSEEIRLVSNPYEPGGTPLTWIAGLYYVDEHSTFTDNETVQDLNQTFAKYGVSGTDPTIISGTFPGAFTGNYVYHGLQEYDTAQYAVFGEATYYPLPNVRLTAGARYSFARDGTNSDQENFYDYGDPGLKTAVGRFYAFTPKFALGWDITPDNTAYINISKGFRLGSENRAIAFIPSEAGSFGTPSYDLKNLGLTSAPVSYGPDKLWNFEIGDKARLLGGRLSMSGDFFYILWNSIAQEIPLVSSGLDFETNAGNATSYGIEFESRGAVTDSLTVGLSGSWVHATLDKGVVVGSALINGTYPGEKVPGTPDYNVDFDAKQNFILNDNLTGYARIDIPWVGESNGNVEGPAGTYGTADYLPANPDYRRPSYITLDASLGLDYGRWSFELFGKNLTNNNKIIQRPDIQGSSVPGYGLVYLGNFVPNTQGFTLRPLTVGLNAALKF
jgi:outer membrane receptor protein involved in Fe transport